MPQVYTSAATTNQNCSVGIGCMSSKRRGTSAKKKVKPNVLFMFIPYQLVLIKRVVIFF